MPSWLCFPDPEKAVLASADMILELRSMQNQSNIPESEDKALQLMESGCGLHHGSLMLGTVGSSDRLETTVIGDTVNMASRLESLNKTLGTRILISRSVQQRISSDSQLQDWIRQIGTWHIRGKSEPQAIFEVFAADPPALRSYKSRTRDEMESIASMLVQSRSDTGLRRALRERMEVQLASVPAGFQDGPAQYLMTQLSGEATSKS